MALKVLNIAQPNAHKVMFHGKNIENKSAYCGIRGTIAIYASKTYSKDRFEHQEHDLVKKSECSFGTIVGFVDMVDSLVDSQITPELRPWFHGPFGYVFTNPRPLKNPIPVSPPKGAIIWWTLEGEAAAACTSQIAPESIVEITNVPRPKDAPEAKYDDPERIPMMPSALLAEIIGPEPITLKELYKEITFYLEDANIAVDDETEDLACDERLKKLTGLDRVTLEQLGDNLRENVTLIEE